jgi:hypothetical protein
VTEGRLGEQERGGATLLRSVGRMIHRIEHSIAGLAIAWPTPARAGKRSVAPVHRRCWKATLLQAESASQEADPHWMDDCLIREALHLVSRGVTRRAGGRDAAHRIPT